MAMRLSDDITRFQKQKKMLQRRPVSFLIQVSPLSQMSGPITVLKHLLRSSHEPVQFAGLLFAE